jgi:hypothetical protein
MSVRCAETTRSATLATHFSGVCSEAPTNERGHRRAPRIRGGRPWSPSTRMSRRSGVQVSCADSAVVPTDVRCRFTDRTRQACHSSRQSPWPHRADTSAAFRRALAEHPELGAAADASNPMGRIGGPEAAPVAVSLASEDLPLPHRQYPVRGRRRAHQRGGVGARSARIRLTVRTGTPFPRGPHGNAVPACRTAVLTQVPAIILPAQLLLKRSLAIS